MTQNQANFKAFEFRADACLEANIAQGWQPETYRIRPRNAGWVLEELRPMTNGHPQWVEDTFSTNKAYVESIYKRRTR